MIGNRAQALLRRDGAHGPILFLYGPSGLKDIVVVQDAGDRPAHKVVRAIVHARRPLAWHRQARTPPAAAPEVV